MITQGYLRRHIAQYRRTGAAQELGLLDVVQTYCLEAMHEQGFFDRGLVFKGGTALRKFYVGSRGRFSTDLDFTFMNDEALSTEIIMWLEEGQEFYEVRMSVKDVEDNRALLVASTPLGEVTLPATVEFSLRGVWVQPPIMPPCRFQYFPGLEFTPSQLRVAEIHEILAEKLAAIWRRNHARDLFDLAAFTEGTLDERLIRRLFYLKVYSDVAEGVSEGPLMIEDLLSARLDSVRGWEDLGELSSPPEPRELVSKVRSRFEFLKFADDTEQALARTSRADRGIAERCVRELVSAW